MFQEEDFLQLSGIQHFEFCRRQWALRNISRSFMSGNRRFLARVTGEVKGNVTLFLARVWKTKQSL